MMISYLKKTFWLHGLYKNIKRYKWLMVGEQSTFGLRG